MNDRFTETISTGIIIDNKTGKEYICEMRIDDDFLNLVHTIAEENEQLKQREEKLLDEIEDFQNLLKQADDKIDYAVSIVKKTCPKEFVSKFKEKMWRWD